MGQIKRLLEHFNMKPLRKGSFVYGGIGKDGVWRTCKFDYHKDNDILKPGTANSIAHSLKFKDVSEMKEFIDERL
jgi:hypothetical protein